MLFVTLLVTMGIKLSVPTMHIYGHTQTLMNVWSYEPHLLIQLTPQTPTMSSARETKTLTPIQYLNYNPDPSCVMRRKEGGPLSSAR